MTSDYASPGDATDTTLTVTPTFRPPLNAGTYYISLSMDMIERIGNQIQPFTGTITATAGAPCAFAVSPLTVAVPAAGSSGDLSVSTSTGCAWTAASDSSWLTVTPTAGSGSLNATYSTSANPSSSPRTGKIAIAGQTVTVTQAGVCNYSLTPVSVAVPAAGASGNLSVTTSSGCSWTAASDSSWLTVSSGTAGSGNGTISYAAAVNSSTVARTGRIGVAGQSATFNQAAATPVPTISPGGIVNSASFQPGIQAGSWVTIQGSLLAQTNPGRIWRSDEFVNGNLPTSLDGVSVTINGQPAYVYFISPAQLNVLAPNDSALGTVNVTVKTPIGTASGTATLQSYSPAFFVFDPGGGKYPAAVHVDGALVGPPNLFGTATASRPAVPGERVLLFGTGFGPTNPPVPAQTVFQGAAPLVDPSQLTIRIGGAPATVDFAGITGNGLYQFNVIVPNIFGGDQPVTAGIGGFNSQSNLFLTIAGDPQPALTTTPGSLTFSIGNGGPQPPSQTLALSSSVHSMPFSLTAATASGGNWLSVTSSTSATPATLTVAVTPGNLAPGTYSGSLQITAAGASNRPLVIPVTLALVPLGLAQQYTISTFAGTGASGSSGDGGSADQARVSPFNVAVDASGNVYLLENNNVDVYRVRKIAAGTHIITNFAGGGSGKDGGPAAQATLDGPSNIALDAAGNLYITEYHGNRVRKVTAATGTISTIAGNGTAGFSGDGGPALDAQLRGPEAIAVDRAGNLYIADNLNNRIRKVAADTGLIKTIAGTGYCGAYSGDGNPASTTPICEPNNVAVDDAGNIYVDSRALPASGLRVLKIAAATGTVTNVAGTGVAGKSCAADGTPATQADLAPWVVTLTAGSSGNVYISDGDDSCIHRVDSGILRLIAGTGRAGFSGDGGPAASAQLYTPRGPSVSQTGAVYFPDSSNYRVRVLTPVFASGSSQTADQR